MAPEDSGLILIATAPDRPGLTAAIAGAVSATGGNILDFEQHVDPYELIYGCRVVIDGRELFDRLETAMNELQLAHEVSWQLHRSTERPRIVIACSSTLHCVGDLLVRSLSDDLPCEVVGVVSDKDAAASLARRMDVPFVHVPVGEMREAQEEAFGAALELLQPDVVVLARYMRILPAWLAEQWEHRMINIHHSTLPAFPGANPRRRAHERGVKIIGATAHYVTAGLDEGPIIAQDAVPVANDTLEALVQRGEDVERTVLARAVRLHLEHRILVFGNRTCVLG